MYKAIMFDVDGTLVPYDYTALPSEIVKKALKKAQKQIEVCLVTGRSISFLQRVLTSLEIDSGYAVVNNGANVINIATKELLYDQSINKKDAEEIIELFHKENIPFYLKESVFGRAHDQGYFPYGKPFENAYMFFTDEQFSTERTEDIFKKLSHLPHITSQKVHHKNPELYSINIAHAYATKLHGIEAIMKKRHFKKEELIGVGDSYTDFPLLMACGLKIAMGNAVDDLKAIADYVAPSVEEDGVVDILEKFVFS